MMHSGHWTSRFRIPGMAIIAAAILGMALWLPTGPAAEELAPFPLPEFTHQHPSQWLGSAPLQRSDLAGKVVLIDFWTFDCWNCYRSFPWLNALEQRFETEDFTIVGIHSPEFDHEHDPARVAAKIREFELRHPVMMDNDFAFWRAMGNRAWPGFYLVDRQGLVRYRFYGETHAGDARATAIEHAISSLLEEYP